MKEKRGHVPAVQSAPGFGLSPIVSNDAPAGRGEATGASGCRANPIANSQRPTTHNGQPATSINLLPAAVGAGAVEINQDVPRLRAFARADEAAVFQFIHDARGAGVAETQAALQQ